MLVRRDVSLSDAPTYRVPCHHKYWACRYEHHRESKTSSKPGIPEVSGPRDYGKGAKAEDCGHQETPSLLHQQALILLVGLSLFQWGNILDNAMRYTPVGGVVTLQVNHQHSTPQIRISDSGPGIPAAIREKVFSRFFRADHAPDNMGAGLGLAIAKRAAERLGASLQLEDGPEGAGLTVLISFPDHTGHAQAARAKSTIA